VFVDLNDNSFWSLGLGLLATRYTDDAERGKAMSLAMSGLAFGVVVGPPIGGVLYQLWGKTIPFLCICGLILFGVCRYIEFYGFFIHRS